VLRATIVDELAARAAGLSLSDADRHQCVEFDDCLDALICALTARAVEKHKTIPPPAELADEARLEGWIHLPESGALSSLL
jgi:predicted RNase H-like nuclease